MKPHRAFITVSLGLAAILGSSLGLCMVLSWAGMVDVHSLGWILSTHAQCQVYGFVALFTMGVALMVLPSFLNTTLQPRWLALASLLLMLAGIAVNFRGPTLPGGLCQSLSAVAFLVVLRFTRKSAPVKKSQSTPLTRGHIFFLATGTLWLTVCPFLALRHSTMAFETVLWGFAGLYIAGIGLRVHTGILGIRGIQASLLAPAAIFWNAGLILRWTSKGPAWTWALSVGVILFVLALRPFRRAYIPPAGGAWLRLFVKTSYAWLLMSAALTCAAEHGFAQLEGPARHMLAVGFVVTMMMGMGLRMIPAFEVKRIPWPKAPWIIYVLVTAGTAIRIPAQAMGRFEWLAVGASLQFAGILAFAATILGTYWVGERVQCSPEQIPPQATLKNDTPKGETSHAAFA